MSPHEDFGWTDHSTRNVGISKEDVEAFMQESAARKGEADNAACHWPEPPSLEAFHGLAGQFVDIVSPHTEADSMALLIQFLVFFGNAAGRSSHFRVEADSHTTNINAIVVGDTASGRKGTSLSQTRKPFEIADRDWAENRIQSGLSSGEGLIWAVRDPIERKDPLKKDGRVVAYETVIGIDDKRLLVLETEFSSTLKVADARGTR